MKKLLILLLLLSVTAAPITEKTTVRALWDSDEAVTTRIDLYMDGLFMGRFQTNEITVLGVTNGIYTREVRFTGPKNGEHTFVSFNVDSNNVLSEPSNVYTQYFRMNGPKNLRIVEK
jgi:hypothetical protein